MRLGKIKTTQIYDAPMGYQGWKLFDYFIYYGPEDAPSQFLCLLKDRLMKCDPAYKNIINLIEKEKSAKIYPLTNREWNQYISNAVQ